MKNNQSESKTIQRIIYLANMTAIAKTSMTRSVVFFADLVAEAPVLPAIGGHSDLVAEALICRRLHRFKNYNFHGVSEDLRISHKSITLLRFMDMLHKLNPMEEVEYVAYKSTTKNTRYFVVLALVRDAHEDVTPILRLYKTAPLRKRSLNDPNAMSEKPYDFTFAAVRS